jgi:hypothetical protein
MDWLTVIGECFDSGKVLYSRHAKYEMENEELGEILEHEVFEAIKISEVIEEYPEDKPYPSVLQEFPR